MRSPADLSDETIRVLLRSSPDCVKLVGGDGRLLFISEGGLRSLEIEDGDQLVGKAWAASWPADQQATVAEGLAKARRRGRARFRGFRPTAGGEPKWWDVLITRLPREIDGAAFLVISRDITECQRALLELEAAGDRVRALLELATDICWRANPAGDIVEHWGWGRFVGRDGPRLQGFDWLAAIHPDHRDRARLLWEAQLASGEGATWEVPIRSDSGEYRWMAVRCRPLFDNDGALREIIGTATDIHDRKRREDDLQIAQERLNIALHAGRMVAWERQVSSDRVRRSENAPDILGIPRDDSASFYSRVDPRDRDALRQGIDAMAIGETASWQVRYAHPDGTDMWLGVRAERPAGDRLVGMVWDVTETKRHEAELWRLANNDPLTDLPNRSAFKRRVEDMMAAAGTGLSLLLIDLDNFKEVNDTLGHAAGDQLLVEAARRLRDCNPLGIVARLGGDEFAVVHSAGHASEVADQILERLRLPLGIQGEQVRASASIGIAHYPQDGESLTEILKCADLALYESKRAGKDRRTAFDRRMSARLVERRSLLGRVKRGIRAGEFRPYYQPKIEIATGRLLGFEALARWADGHQGVRAPHHFSAAFEDHETSLLIGAQMLDRVIEDMRAWRRDGLDFGSVAINLSDSQLSREDLSSFILGRLIANDLPPSMLEVEITESVFFGKDRELVSALLEELADSGIGIALDDFGTGFASLTHLKAHPVSHIKIDRSFIEHLGQNDNDTAIVTAIVNLARTLRMRVTAEGVETDRQETILRQMGCEAAQGHLYARPMPASRVPWFVEARTGSTPREVVAGRGG